MIAKDRMFDSRGSLASALASDVANVLGGAIGRNGSAVLAVSGGKTPQLFFDTLSHFDLKWNRVTITLVDDRNVPEDDERSNAGFLRHHLFRNRAEKATFVPLYQNPEAASLPSFDAVVLGMGLDGHTASFFPDGNNLATALDPHTDQRIVEMKAPGAPEARTTFTLPDLLKADFIGLHLEGQDKRAAYARAMGDGPVEEMPIRAVLRSRRPITLYWCP